MEGGSQRFYSLLFLGLFAGPFCGAQDPTITAEPLNISEEDEGKAGTTTVQLVPESATPLSEVKTMNQERHFIEVADVPSSLLILEGHSVSLTCKFSVSKKANVTWRKSCSPNCSQSFNVTSNHPGIRVVEKKGVSNLNFERVKIRDSGMYYCTVRSFDDYGQSCGTYLWVRRPRPTSFLNIRESVKNKIITAEGFLLLICAIGPGLFLLLRKRWENESLLQAKKKKCEEENLYEGLNLDECSMYEDISRGLQATYQDIGNIKVIDLQLEKPEKP